MKTITISGYNRQKKPLLEIGDILIQDDHYTINTKLGTLWRPLKKGYKLNGKVVAIKKSFYQTLNNVNKLTMERISESPKGEKLRKRYLVWQNIEDGLLIR